MTVNSSIVAEAGSSNGGWLWKRGMGRTTFGGTSWQRRYLECSSTKLLWFDKDPANRGGAKEKGGLLWTNVVMVVPVCNVHPSGTEFANDHKFQTAAGECPGEASQFGVVFQDVEKGASIEVLLLRAETERDRCSWIGRLLGMMMTYSPHARLSTVLSVDCLDDNNLRALCGELGGRVVLRADVSDEEASKAQAISKVKQTEAAAAEQTSALQQQVNKLTLDIGKEEARRKQAEDNVAALRKDLLAMAGKLRQMENASIATAGGNDGRGGGEQRDAATAAPQSSRGGVLRVGGIAVVGLSAFLLYTRLRGGRHVS